MNKLILLTPYFLERLIWIVVIMVVTIMDGGPAIADLEILFNARRCIQDSLFRVWRAVIQKEGRVNMFYKFLFV